MSPAPRNHENDRDSGAKPSSVAQNVGEKPVALEMLRARAKVQARLKKRIRCATSTPNLNERLTRPPVTVEPMCGVIVPKDGEATGLGKSAMTKTVSLLEAVDQNGIYPTLDPNSRFSQGSLRFQPIMPDNPGSAPQPSGGLAPGFRTDTIHSINSHLQHSKLPGRVRRYFLENMQAMKLSV